MLAAAERCDISARHAKLIVEEVKQAVANWAAFAAEARLDKRSTDIIARLFA